MTRRRASREDARGPRGRMGGAGTVGAAVALVVVLSIGPLAGASRTQVAPYTHTTSTITQGAYRFGSCRATGLISKPTWLPTTGNVTGIAASAAKSCKYGPAGNGYATVHTVAEFDVWLPLHVRSGAHNVSVGISYALSVRGSVTGAAVCPLPAQTPGKYTYSDCSYTISASSQWGQEIFDATNGSVLFGDHANVQGPENSSTQSNDSYCNGSGTCSTTNSSSTCSGASSYTNCVAWGSSVAGANTTWIDTGRNCLYLVNGRCTAWHNWTLNGSHRLWIVLWFDYLADVAILQYNPGLTVSASLNAATAGNAGWKVNSVTIS